MKKKTVMMLPMKRKKLSILIKVETTVTNLSHRIATSITITIIKNTAVEIISIGENASLDVGPLLVAR
jgi:hypothetical protein